MINYHYYDDLTNEQIDLIEDLGIDFTCNTCGTELTIFDTECGECQELTYWSTDCQVQDVIAEITGEQE